MGADDRDLEDAMTYREIRKLFRKYGQPEELTRRNPRLTLEVLAWLAAAGLGKEALESINMYLEFRRSRNDLYKTWAEIAELQTYAKALRIRYPGPSRPRRLQAKVAMEGEDAVYRAWNIGVRVRQGMMLAERAAQWKMNGGAKVAATINSLGWCPTKVRVVGIARIAAPNVLSRILPCVCISLDGGHVVRVYHHAPLYRAESLLQLSQTDLDSLYRLNTPRLPLP